MNPLDVHEHLSVENDRRIIGALRSGATIRSHTQLTVTGSVSGVVNVEEGGILMVQGTFTGSVSSNAGTIILYGVAELDLGAIVGNTVVGVDSLITTPRGEVFRLLPDGSLDKITESLTGDNGLSVRTDRVCFFDPRTSRFEPLGNVSAR